jgi:hypothetical protein
MMKRTLMMVAALAFATTALAQTQVKYVKYQAGNRVSWGVLDNDTIREISAAPWAGGKANGRTLKLAEVKLMAPAEATKVIAAGLNYKSHIGEQPAAKYVGLFAKLPTSIIGHEENIIYPADATDLHYEAEIVVVIGKRASNITEAQVPQQSGSEEAVAVHPLDGSMMSARLHLNEIFQIQNALRADAHCARAAGDGSRWSADLRAILGLSRQMRQTAKQTAASTDC